ncbi:hypothetical protein J1N35_008662 [Gossypium stocksii]|uniref:Uncharacterized protein n=1 Tax=Gossypium stocksii TaxID=47602 RepID=A0A9D3W874_9ROSI|nr:hypothetical protein J1N35_008662 [Gossypium stocksii]
MIKSFQIAKDLPSHVSDGDSIQHLITRPEFNPITGFLRINWILVYPIPVYHNLGKSFQFSASSKSELLTTLDGKVFAKMHRLVCQYLIALEILKHVFCGRINKVKFNQAKDSDNSMHDAKKQRYMHIIEAYDRENVGSFISMGHNYDKEYNNVVLMGQYLFIHITMVICISGKQLLLMVRMMKFSYRWGPVIVRRIPIFFLLVGFIKNTKLSRYTARCYSSS